jgi:hypothetical protein
MQQQGGCNSRRAMDKVKPEGCQSYENRKPPGFPSTLGGPWVDEEGLSSLS